jgi:hypothetical protein
MAEEFAGMETPVPEFVLIVWEYEVPLFTT